MSKSRSFSIYLLKQGFDATNALTDGHNLDVQAQASNLPKGASLFVMDSPAYAPWWKDYFGVTKNLKQVSKGALIFLPVKGRCFALSFGHVYHNLKDEGYEHDFGLRVTLNCVDPDELKSADILEPGAARRRRTQVPVASSLTLLDFDRDSDILKRLTGKVKKEQAELFKHATGASNLRISSKLPSTELPGLCKELLKLYESSAFEETFPDIQNIAPINDPSLINLLDVKLLEAVKSKAEHLYLAIPDIVSHENGPYYAFSGKGTSLLYEDLYLEHYYEYLDENSVQLDELNIEDLRHHRIAQTDEDGASNKTYSLFKCLIYDLTLESAGSTYHLNEGKWYKVNDDYVKKLKKYLDPLCGEHSLPDYTHESEGDYNKSVANNNHNLICLDTKNIAPPKQTQIEPCDLLSVENDQAVLYHVKRSTSSSQLSHLFNQGANAISLLRLEKESVKKLKKLIKENIITGEIESFALPIDGNRLRAVFAIITRKTKTKKSDNLPLFSRISLMRVMKDFELMGINASYVFVNDASPSSKGKKKPRKKKEEKSK